MNRPCAGKGLVCARSDRVGPGATARRRARQGRARTAAARRRRLASTAAAASCASNPTGLGPPSWRSNEPFATLLEDPSLVGPPSLARCHLGLKGGLRSRARAPGPTRTQW